MTISLPPQVTVTETNYGAVLLDERTGHYWQTNGVGAVVLRCLRDGGRVESVVATMQARYPDSAEQIASDVRHFVDKLVAARMLAS
jgi:hypothetical protein